jgi:uncharacterized membrane protein YoaK (UPF0700 family)
MVSTERTRASSLFHSPAATRDTLVVLLAFTAGCVDAISYLGLGRIFTANMTGNTVLLGLALGQAQGLAALRSAVALAGYLAGAAGGALLSGRAAKQTLWPPAVTTICACELLILAALSVTGAVLLSPSAGGVIDLFILLVATAMGLQSVAVTALGIRGVATTYITGTWTTMMVGLVSKLPLALARPSGAEPRPGTGMQTAVVGVYLLAAVVGGAADARWHLRALAVPTVAVAAVVAIAWRRFHGPMGPMARARTQGG